MALYHEVQGPKGRGTSKVQENCSAQDRTLTTLQKALAEQVRLGTLRRAIFSPIIFSSSEMEEPGFIYLLIIVLA